MNKLKKTILSVIFLICATSIVPSTVSATEANGQVRALTYSNYDSIASQGIVIIDFYADWCGPCKRLAPAYREVAQEFTGKATFVKVNTDSEPGLAKKYGITALPTLIMLRDGKEISRRGPCSKSELQAWVASEVRKG